MTLEIPADWLPTPENVEALTAFNFNDQAGRFNYISNADKLDVRAMLKDVIARIEGRMANEPGATQ